MTFVFITSKYTNYPVFNFMCFNLKVQITSPSSDQRNMTIDLPVDKPVPTLPYSLKNCGPKVVVSYFNG